MTQHNIGASHRLKEPADIPAALKAYYQADDTNSQIQKPNDDDYRISGDIHYWIYQCRLKIYPVDILATIEAVKATINEYNQIKKMTDRDYRSIRRDHNNLIFIYMDMPNTTHAEVIKSALNGIEAGKHIKEKSQADIRAFGNLYYDLAYSYANNIKPDYQAALDAELILTLRKSSSFFCFN